MDAGAGNHLLLHEERRAELDLAADSERVDAVIAAALPGLATGEKRGARPKLDPPITGCPLIFSQLRYALRIQIDQVEQAVCALIVDGGNAYYKDSVRRAVELASYGVRFVDCGVSGGVWGLEQGYALMFGGSPGAARAIEPFVKLLAPAPDRGWLHCGPSGSGHFVKMIHNGIEYGVMQALAEGFALMKSKAEFGLDVAAIAEMWRHGSVVRSWLLDLTAEFLREDAELADVAPLVADSGEGRWTVAEAIEQGIPAPVLSLALLMRFASQGKGEYADRVLAMMRKGFGGHKVVTVAPHTGSGK